MKKLYSVALPVTMTAMLTACSVGGTTATTETSATAESVDVTEEATTAATESSTEAETTEISDAIGGGAPWIDSDIKENVTADTVTDPRDDFHLYANKEWILNNEIPEGYSGWSHYMERGMEVNQQCMELLVDETLTGHDAELIQTYYKLVLDWDARNEEGVTSLQELYDAILAVNDIEDVTKLLTDSETADYLYPFMSFGATTGFNDPDKYIVAVMEPGVLLTDSAEYAERTEYGDMYYGYRKDLFVYLAERLGMSETEAQACFDGAISIEAKLSENIYTTNEQYSDDYYDLINNEMSYDDMTALNSVFPLGEIISNAGYKYDGVYLVTHPDYLTALDEIYTNDNLEEIKDLLLVRYVLGCAGSLDRETYDKANELYGLYFGVTGTVSDEEMAYDAVVSALPASMQKVYISKYGSAEDKARMEELCQLVIDTYRELLSENEWASEEVKSYAIEKLDKMTIHAAYPDKFRDTSNIDISGCSLMEAENIIAEIEDEYDKSLIGTEVDKEMWAEGFNILECNAYYDPSENTINMVIGMMGEPFYSSDMSTEELYASIGAFWVGHEVSHAFDSSGAQFDADGQLRDWWTQADKEEFQSRITKMDDYLDGIVAFGDYNFIGSNIDTEMVADMTGLQCALRMASKVEGFDYEKFFIKYAQMNASLDLYSSELSQLLQDPHPLNYSRTNVPVQQFEEFYEAFDIKEGDNMYLAPEDRLLVW